MWTISPTERFSRQYKRYEKNHPRELQSVLRNLDAYFKALLAGAKPLQIKYGFVRSEGRGVWRIGQTGGRSLAATRLYVYPDTDEEVLHLLTIGDKDKRSQKNDIVECHSFVDHLTYRKKENNEPGAEKPGDGGPGASGAPEAVP